MRSYIVDDRNASFFRVTILIKRRLKEAADSNVPVIQRSWRGTWPIAPTKVAGGGDLMGLVARQWEFRIPPEKSELIRINSA